MAEINTKKKHTKRVEKQEEYNEDDDEAPASARK